MAVRHRHIPRFVSFNKERLVSFSRTFGTKTSKKEREPLGDKRHQVVSEFFCHQSISGQFDPYGSWNSEKTSPVSECGTTLIPSMEDISTQTSFSGVFKLARDEKKRATKNDGNPVQHFSSGIHEYTADNSKEKRRTDSAFETEDYPYLQPTGYLRFPYPGRKVISTKSSAHGERASIWQREPALHKVDNFEKSKAEPHTTCFQMLGNWRFCKIKQTRE